MKQPHWTILFIDDDEDDYLLIKDYLSAIERVKIEISWAATYEAGWELLPTAPWDVVLIDYDLGSHNGIKFIREAVAKGFKVPFIMVTGRGSYEKDVEAMEAGAFDYLTKIEVNPSLLERVIRYALARKQVEDELEQRVQERTEQLQVALEELQVFAEELGQQNAELINAENRIDKEFFRYKYFFEFSPQGYIVTDRSGKILEINRKASTLLNVEQRFLVGKPLASFIGRDSQRAFYKVLNEYPEPGQIKTLQTVLQPRGEKLLNRFITVAPFFGSEEKVVELCWLIHEENSL